MESGIEEAYGWEPDGQLHGCPTCNVTWFGADDRCWVCGQAADGPAAAVPPNGSQTWSAARCVEGADDEETAAFVRRVVAAPPPVAGDVSGMAGIVMPVLGS
ncbi:MAG TPA: hypothetical protein VJ622_04005 [Acidimicrobiia bacterium]|nr:hypothetical protein [Acidimicrobiia bacterium]HMC81167.1 hypothetical protein [Acidimicrobiia bacterium]